MNNNPHPHGAHIPVGETARQSQHMSEVAAGETKHGEEESAGRGCDINQDGQRS